MGTHSNSADRILDAALSLFAEKGYEATSTREICELAGITKPTLYYFFESKEGVYRALIQRADKLFQSLLRQGLQSPGTLRDRYKKSFELIFEEAQKQMRLARFMFGIVWASNVPLASELHRSYEVAVSYMADAANAAMEAGELRPGSVQIRMLVLMGSFMEAISDFLTIGHPELTRELAHGIVDTIFDGWVPLETKA